MLFSRLLLLSAIPFLALACAKPLKVPPESKLLIMAPAPFNFPTTDLPDCTLYYVDDSTGQVIVALPYRKGAQVSVNGLDNGHKYRVYLAPPVLKSN